MSKRAVSNEVSTIFVTCPHCGEELSILVRAISFTSWLPNPINYTCQCQCCRGSFKFEFTT